MFPIIIISNLKIGSLTNVQIIHNRRVGDEQVEAEHLPDAVGIGIFPKIPYKISEDNKKIIFENLASKESVAIHYMFPLPKSYFTQPFPIEQRLNGEFLIRSDQAVAKPRQLVEAFYVPKWLETFLWLLLIIGFWVSVRFLTNLIALISGYIRCNFC